MQYRKPRVVAIKVVGRMMPPPSLPDTLSG